MKLLFRLLDLMDRDLFGIDHEMWGKVKQALGSTAGPLAIANDVIVEFAGILGVMFTTFTQSDGFRAI